MAQSRATPPSVHAADCDIWKVPDISIPDALLGEGYQDEAVVAYLSGVGPVYSALSRILAQFSGLFLLSMNTGTTSLPLDHAMYSTACDQLSEAGERLAAIKSVPATEKHFQAMVEIKSQLHRVATHMDRLSGKRGDKARKTAILEIVRKLQSVQRLLIATAEPDAHITPVDFGNACCSCRNLEARQTSIT